MKTYTRFENKVVCSECDREQSWGGDSISCIAWPLELCQECGADKFVQKKYKSTWENRIFWDDRLIEEIEVIDNK